MYHDQDNVKRKSVAYVSRSRLWEIIINLPMFHDQDFYN